MKKLFLISVLFLGACGSIGIGTNHDVHIHNESKYTVTATGDHGTLDIAPNTVANIHGKHPIHLTCESKDCAPQMIDTDTNITALLLDLIPGMIISWAPYFIDAVTGGISNLPENYTYKC